MIGLLLAGIVGGLASVQINPYVGSADPPCYNKYEGYKDKLGSYFSDLDLNLDDLKCLFGHAIAKEDSAFVENLLENVSGLSPDQIIRTLGLAFKMNIYEPFIDELFRGIQDRYQIINDEGIYQHEMGGRTLNFSKQLDHVLSNLDKFFPVLCRYIHSKVSISDLSKACEKFEVQYYKMKAAPDNSAIAVKFSQKFVNTFGNLCYEFSRIR
jgi:hypothetical protein